MPLNHSLINRIALSSEHEVTIPGQLIARIEEYNKKDYQAIARGKEERAKWLHSKNKIKKEKTSDQ